MQISYTATRLCMLSQETVAPGAHRRKTCQISRQVTALPTWYNKKELWERGFGKRKRDQAAPFTDSVQTDCFSL